MSFFRNKKKKKHDTLSKTKQSKTKNKKLNRTKSYVRNWWAAGRKPVHYRPGGLRRYQTCSTGWSKGPQGQTDPTGPDRKGN